MTPNTTTNNSTTTTSGNATHSPLGSDEKNHKAPPAEDKFVLPWEMYRLTETVHIPDEDKIKYPKWLLFYHLATKGYQLGAVAGLCAGVPMAWMDKSAFNITKVDRRALIQSMMRYSVWSAVAGFVVLSASGVVLARNYYDDNELNDIAFRVYHNPTLKEWELCGMGGSVSGLVAGLWSVNKKSAATSVLHNYSRTYRVLRSSVVGTSIGMAAFALLQTRRLFD